MAKHLKFVTRPLRLHFEAYHTKSKSGLYFDGTQCLINPANQIARIRGEALFNQHFFNALSEKNIHDDASRWQFYQVLVLNKHFLIEVCEHAGLLDGFVIDNLEQLKTDQNPLYGQYAFAAICIVLWDMEQRDKKPNPSHVVRHFIEHNAAQVVACKQPKKPMRDQQLQDIKHALYGKWGVMPAIKESFSTTADEVTFSLLAKSDKYQPVTLITLQGSRVKPTRTKAYQQLWQLTQSQFFKPPDLIEKPDAR